MRIAPVAQRVNIRIAPRQQHAVKVFSDRRDKLFFGNQRNVHGHSARFTNGLAVKARKIETLCLKINAHGDSYARPLFFHQLNLPLFSQEKLFSIRFTYDSHHSSNPILTLPLSQSNSNS